MKLFGWLKWFRRGPETPEVVELPSIQAEYIYVKRLTCKKCGSPTEAKRLCNDGEKNGRMHDRWNITCTRCGTSRQIILAVPPMFSNNQITQLLGDALKNLGIDPNQNR